MKQLILLLILINSFNLFAQTTGPAIKIIDQNATGDQYARDRVIVKPGTNGATHITPHAHIYLDENLLSPASETYSATGFDPTSSVTLDYNLAVGTTAGIPGITPMGGASYSIPFDIPKGTGGIIPEGLGLSYNSMSGQGIAGLGWSLTGLSAITRAGRTMHDDGYVTAINLSLQDRFVYDGKILIPEDPDITHNGGHGKVYHTEQESFARIISYGTSTYEGPEWFEVTTKEGLKIEFGKTSDSKLNGESDFWTPLTGVTSTVNVMWMVNKITDQQGNYITYEYETNDNSEIVIKKIKYTGNALANPVINTDSEIEFFYEVSSVPSKINIGQKEITKSMLLWKVKIKSGDGLYKTYHVSYNKSSIWEFLTQVQESNSLGEKLNATYFNYEPLQDDPGAVTMLPCLDANGDSYEPDLTDRKITYLDYNGDGFKDLLVYPAISNSTTGTGYWALYENNKQNEFIIKQDQQSVSFPVGSTLTAYNPYLMENYDVRYYNARTMNSDFNGDGKEDFLIYSTFIDGGFNKVKIQPFLAGNGGYSAQPSGGFDVTLSSSSNSGADESILVHTGDINGDNRQDIIVIERNSFNTYVRVIADIYALSPVYDIVLPGEYSVKNIVTADKLSEGKISLCGFAKLSITDPGFYDVSYSKASQDLTFYETSEPGFNYSCDLGTTYSFAGDFNGDSHLDRLYLENGSWKVKIKGAVYAAGISETPVSNNCHQVFYVVDVNGDGKSDVVVLNHYGSNTFLNKYVSVGSYFISETTAYIHDDDSDFYNYNVSFGDINGDAINDLIFDSKIVNDHQSFTFFFNKGLNKNVLRKVTDGFNQTVEYNYDPLSGGHDYLVDDYQTYPFIVLNTPIKTVRNIKTKNGIGGISTKSFEYYNPVINIHGKGLLGFEKLESYNDVTEILSKSFKSVNTSKAILIANQNQVFSKHNNTVTALNTTVLTNVVYNVNTYGNNSVYIIKNTQVTSSNLLQNTVTTTYNSIDGNGNVYHSSTEMDNVQTNVTDISYDNTVLSTVPYLPEIITKTISRGGSSSNSSTITNEYYSNTLLKSSTTGNPFSNEKNVKTNYEYYQTGNIKKTIISAPNSSITLADLETNYEYDAKFKNATKITNALGQATNYQYHPLFNTVTSVTDPTGLITTSQYDDWGRVVKNTDINNVVTNTACNWVTSGEINAGAHPSEFSNSINNVTYKITSSKAGSPTNTSYFDALGRSVLNRTEDLSDENYMAVSYNANGLAIAKSSNYRITNTGGYKKIITAYAYDDLLRLSQTTTTDEGESTPVVTHKHYTFVNKESIEENVDGLNNSTKTFTDASGKVVKILDAKNTPIIYTTFFLPDNQRKERTTVNGIITESFFDEVGNRIKLSDQYAGDTEYEYDAFGRQIRQEDPNGNIYEMEYDIAGRCTLKTETVSQQQYEYKYITSGNGLNKLDYITGPGNIKYDYTYDNKGRQIKLDEDHNTTHYITEYTYDNFNNVTSVKYPSGFIINKTYSNKGYLQNIKNGNNIIWQGNEANQLGQYTNYQYGISTSPTIEATYNNYGFLTSKVASNIFDMGYTYDHKSGNLTNRSNNIDNAYKQTYTENYTYDELNRLSTFGHTLSGGADQTMEYFDNGSIKKKPDVSASNYMYGGNAIRLNKIEDPIPSNQVMEQDIVYNEFLKPSSITEAITANTSIKLDYTYGPDQQRIEGKWYTVGNTTPYRTRTYANNYEVNTENGKSNYVHYIDAPTGLCAMYVIEKLDSDPAPTNGTGGNLYYIYTDHLGSINTVVKSDLSETFEQNFDSWGKRRDAYTLTPILGGDAGLPDWLYRGYTGQEMLDEFNLVNLNSRLYDPIIGQMLGADNYISNPANTQAYNRFTYCFNNPLKYIDPTGNWGEDPNSYSYGYGALSPSYNYSNSSSYGYNYNSNYSGYNTGYGYNSTSYTGSSYTNNGLISSYSYTNSYSFNNSVTYGAESVNYNYNNSQSTNYNVTINGQSYDYSYSSQFSSNISYPNYNYQIKQQLNALESETKGKNGPGADFYIGNVVGAAEINVANIITDRAKYSFTQAPWETRIPIKGDLVIRTPVGNINTTSSFLDDLAFGLKWGGRVLGAYNAYNIGSEYEAGKISTSQLVMEQGTNAYSTFGGIYGAAWGIGWELGRFTVGTDWYQRNIYGRYIPEPYECVTCPKE